MSGTAGDGGGSSAAAPAPQVGMLAATPQNVPLMNPTPQNQGYGPDQSAQALLQLLGRQQLASK